MAAVKAVVTTVAAKNNVAIPVLTNAAMAKAVPHHAVLVRRAVARAVARGVDHKAGTAAVMEAGTAAVKTVINMMATSCLATSTP
jgi:hypothetical protein